MKWRILNMADLRACPDVLAILESVAEVVSLPAEQDVLREQIGGFDGYYASLQARVDRAVLDRAARLA